MTRLFHGRTRRELWLLGAPLACLLVIEICANPHFLPVVHAQDGAAESTKTLVMDRLYRTDPIEVVKVLVAASEAESSPPSNDENRRAILGNVGHYAARGPALGAAAYRLQSDDNWLSKLSFVLKNRTAKTIGVVVITVYLPLPAPAPPGPPYIKSEGLFSFGPLPAMLANTNAASDIPARYNTAIRFAPGQEMTFTLADCKATLHHLLSHAGPLSDAPLCRVLIQVAFEDGMRWVQGDYSKPDPERPGEFVLMNEGYFPGLLMVPPV